MDIQHFFVYSIVIFLTGSGTSTFSAADIIAENITISSATPTTTVDTTSNSTANTTATTIFITTSTTNVVTNSDNDGQMDEANFVSDIIKDYHSAGEATSPEDHQNVLESGARPELVLNTAWLTINSTVAYAIEVWAQIEECVKCNLVLITRIEELEVRTILANTTHQTDLRLVKTGEKDYFCGFKKTFRENGDYVLIVSQTAQVRNATCELKLINDPDIPELAILYVFIGLVGLAFAYVAGKKLFIYFRRAAAHKRDSMDVTSANDQDGGDAMQMSNGRSDKDENATDASKTAPESPKKKQRLRSLDTFRGFTLALMIFVNYGGGGYWFFEHAAWNGIHLADLVFPWFVFIMGVSINFSFRSMFRNSWNVPKVTWKIVWRAAKLFLIGFMMGTHYEVADLNEVRVLGVLQRLALTYLISALIHYSCTRRSDSHQEKKWAMFRDLVLYIPEWVVNLLLLAVHTSLIYALPVPGCPTGYVGPGGISEGGAYMNCTGGATGYVDSLMLGYEHMYSHPTPEVVYQTKIPFDPEGFLGTLNCVFLCFLGIQCGRIILIYQSHKERLIRFLIWAIVLGTLGALLTKCSRDDGWIPANKNIWSFSYSLITASFGYILLSGIYIITDLLEIWQGQPFTYPGMNSIVIYICHGIFANTFPVSFVVGKQHWKLLLRSVWGTAFWLIVAYWLYIKKIFIAL